MAAEASELDENRALDQRRWHHCFCNGAAGDRTGGHDRTLWQLGAFVASLVRYCRYRVGIFVGLERSANSESEMGATCSHWRQRFAVFGAGLGFDHGLGSGSEISLTGTVDQRSF